MLGSGLSQNGGVFEVFGKMVIPKHLHEPLRVNPHLLSRLKTAVAQSVIVSLQTVDTAPRILSESIVQERVNMCMDILEVGYYELGISLTHLLDALEDTLMWSLRGGPSSYEEHAVAHSEAGSWGVKGEENAPVPITETEELHLDEVPDNEE
jgi:hypothetical protein